MMGKLKRMMAWSDGDAAAWGLDQQLQVMEEDPTEEETEETSLEEPETQPEGLTGWSPGSNRDHYADLVRSSIENGGKYGDQHIHIGWLRMILARLEGRDIEPDAQWEGFEPSLPEAELSPLLAEK